MTLNIDEKEQAVRYFLGELSDAERDSIEDRFFSDEDYSRFLDSVETDLIDDYVRGELEFEQKRGFEKNYLISERRRERVDNARLLQTELFDKKQEVTLVAPQISFWERVENFFRVPNLAWAGSLAIIALLFVFGGMWLFRPDNQIAVLENNNQIPVATPTVQISPQPETNNNQNETPVNSNAQPKPSPSKPDSNRKEETTPAPQQPIFAAFTLLPPTRSSERPTFIVPRQAEIVRLAVVHDNREKFVKYRVEIRDADGDLIWSREIPVNAKTLSKPLSLNVRSNALKSGLHELTLSGATADGQLEEINFYNFSVQKK